MSEKMEPVLSAEEWARAKDQDALTDVPVGEHVVAYVADGIVRIALLEKPGVATGAIDQPARAIALLNNALSDSDPRKITRQMVANLRECSDLIVASDHRPSELDGYIILLREYAGALESYLAPEK
jgi:hypothetical protein